MSSGSKIFITISTSEIYKNVPAMNKNDQLVKSSKPAINKPHRTPIMHITPDTALNTSARFRETPARRRTAKSPISCGSSWQSTAIAVPKPAVKLVANEAPIARP